MKSPHTTDCTGLSSVQQVGPTVGETPNSAVVISKTEDVKKDAIDSANFGSGSEGTVNLGVVVSKAEDIMKVAFGTANAGSGDVGLPGRGRQSSHNQTTKSTR